MLLRLRVVIVEQSVRFARFEIDHNDRADAGLGDKRDVRRVVNTHVH